MKNNTKIFNILFFIAVVTSYTSNAGLISLGNGNITTNTTEQYIVDHLNQREYLRLDVLGALTYEEQVELTTSGQYADFTIADHLINFDFITSLLDGKTGACNATRNVNGYCNKLSANKDVWSEGLLGFSYTTNADYWLFENKQAGAFQDFGLAGMLTNGAILSFQNWSSLRSANNRSLSLTSPVHFLMYRDIPPVVAMPRQLRLQTLSVSEPSTVAIFLLAMFIPFCARLKYNKVNFKKLD